MNLFRSPIDGNGLARALAAGALLIMSCTLVWRFVGFVNRSVWAINSTHGLDYGEGIVWQQMRMISNGHGYSPLEAYPAIVFHYPPVFHLVTLAVASVTSWGDLAAGRIVSFLSTLIAAALVGSIAGLISSNSTRITRWICGSAAFLVCLSCYPIVVWAPLMRVDMLASALSLAGLLFSMLALRRPWLIYLASCFFVAAVFTKQTMVAAPAAAFFVLLILKPRLAVRGIVTCFSVGLVALAGLSIITSGQFTHHIFGYNINRFSLDRLRGVFHILHQHLAYIIVGLAGVTFAFYRLIFRREGCGAADRMGSRFDVTSTRYIIAASYAAASALTLVLVGKSGSTINYYIEWFFAGSIIVGAAVHAAAEIVFRPNGAKFASWSIILIGIGVPALISYGALTVPTVESGDQIKTVSDQAQLNLLISKIREARRPVISDNMVIVRQAGKEVVLEPAIIAELTSTKVYDERHLLQMINDKDFAFFVTEGVAGQVLFDSRYSPAVAKAMSRNYPRLERLAGLTVHLADK